MSFMDLAHSIMRANWGNDRIWCSQKDFVIARQIYTQLVTRHSFDFISVSSAHIR